MQILQVVLTALLSVAALFIITKIMGHKQVSQLNFFDYVSGITIGSIGAELATELETPENPLIALAIYGLTSVLLSLIADKIPRTRKYINGTPTILMSEGRMFRKNFKQAKLDLSEFMLMCREMGYFDLSEIHTAIFENNGKLSILPNAQSRPVSAKDLNIKVKQTNIATELIMDGRIMGENLTRIGHDVNWLMNNLKSRGYSNAKQILLGIYEKENDTLTLYPTE